MACKGLPSHAHTTLSPRYPQFLQENIPMAQQIRTSSSQRTRRYVPEPENAFAPVVLRWEQYQDVLHVHSIESEDSQPAPATTGVKHFLHMHRQTGLTSKPCLDHIDYALLSRPQSTTTTTMASAPLSLTPHPRAPLPPSPPTAYASAIYAGKTHNPAVFLAILLLAQHNLPHLDLVSALNHIPNIAPTDALPALVTAAGPPFLDTRSPRPRRDSDEEINIAFLPRFYDNGTRHALGFFQVVGCPRRGKVLGTAFFTPCEEDELRRYGLVAYVEGADGVAQGDGELGVETMSRVGCEKGGWREKDTVEDYEEWKLVYRVVSVAWETRMRLMRSNGG